jgi:hypothetical protein
MHGPYLGVYTIVVGGGAIGAGDGIWAIADRRGGGIGGGCCRGIWDRARNPGNGCGARHGCHNGVGAGMDGMSKGRAAVRL